MSWATIHISHRFFFLRFRTSILQATTWLTQPKPLGSIVRVTELVGSQSAPIGTPTSITCSDRTCSSIASPATILGISASPSWWSRARKPHGAPEGSFSVAGPIVRIHLPPAESPRPSVPAGLHSSLSWTESSNPASSSGESSERLDSFGAIGDGDLSILTLVRGVGRRP